MTLAPAIPVELAAAEEELQALSGEGHKPLILLT
jgi:hypothetical protein